LFFAWNRHDHFRRIDKSMLIKGLLWIHVLMLGGAVLFASEEILVKADGTRIIIFDDGTWKPYVRPETGAPPSVKTVLTCGDLIQTVTDKMTGATYIAAQRPIEISADNKTGFTLSLRAGQEGGPVMNIKVFGMGGCMDENARINCLFDDGERMEFQADNKFNCDGDVSILFGGIHGKKDQLAKLSTTKLTALRVWGSKGFLERDLTADNAARVLETLKCLQKKPEEK
jgi:hypothetical protein